MAKPLFYTTYYTGDQWGSAIVDEYGFTVFWNGQEFETEREAIETARASLAMQRHLQEARAKGRRNTPL